MAYHVTPTRNLFRIMREGLAPRIGPRSRRLGEAVAAVYLFEDADSLQDALDNWLGDEFAEDAMLALLRVEVPAGTRLAEGAGFEMAAIDALPPECLSVLSRDLGGLTGAELAAPPPAP